MNLDYSVYPDVDVLPKDLATPEDKTDYVSRICNVLGFGIVPTVDTAYCTTVRVFNLDSHEAYSLDRREKIISTYEAGNTSICKVAERFQVSKNTVQSLLKRKQATGTLNPTPATKR